MASPGQGLPAQLTPEQIAVIQKMISDAEAAKIAEANAASPEAQAVASIAAAAREYASERSHPHDYGRVIGAVVDALTHLATVIGDVTTRLDGLEATIAAPKDGTVAIPSPIEEGA
jgi:hypothetical protein